MSAPKTRKPKKCPICGADFMPKWHQVFCCRECYVEARRHPAVYKDALRAHEVAHGKTAVCPFCGKPAYPKAVYCKNCIAEGFNNVHKMFGTTNGWDRPTTKRKLTHKDKDAIHNADRYGTVYHFVGAAKNWGQAK